MAFFAKKTAAELPLFRELETDPATGQPVMHFAFLQLMHRAASSMASS